MREYIGILLLLVTVTQAGKHYLRQARVHYLSDRSDPQIQLEHHHYVIDTSIDEDRADSGVINDDYNEIDDSTTQTKLNHHKKALKMNLPEEVFRNKSIAVEVPVREVVSILPVDYNESPLNISFKPLGGDFILENNMTVTINDQDITEAVIDLVKIILSHMSKNYTVDDILDKLLAENLFITAEIKERTKNPVDIYLELLGDIVKFEDKTNESTTFNEEQSSIFEDDPEETTTELGVIDYSDDSNIPEFYYDDGPAIPEHIDQDDLLIGDSFENKGNIDLMSNDKSDFTLEETTTEQVSTQSESFNVAFPELYKDLAIFKSIPKKGRSSDIRVKKRAQMFRDVVEINPEERDVISKSTVGPVKQAPITDFKSKTDSDFPKFIKINHVNISTELLVNTSAGSLLGHMKLSTRGEKISEFLGIPFAKPPTGDLRFKPPKATEPWKGIMNNSQRNPQCWSSHFSNSWDVSIIRRMLIIR